MSAWSIPIGVMAFSLSLAVNTIVTSLLILKITLEYRHTKFLILDWRRNGIVPVIAILIETGLVTFVGQLTWTISYGLQNDGVFTLFGGVVVVLYVGVSLRSI